MTTAIKTKQIEFIELMKTFNNFVSKKGLRPVLKNVYYDGKNFIATNTHIALFVNSENVKNIPDYIVNGSLIDPRKMKLSDEKLNYPDVSRLIPKEYDSNTTISLDGYLNDLIKDMKELCKTDRIISKLTPSSQIAIMDTGNKFDNKFSLSIKGDNQNDKISINNIVQGESIKLHVNVKYLIGALTTCKKLSKLNDNKCTLEIIGAMRPMNFRQENVFDLIVSPVRVY
jgi:DNA polymerase III sliding clamp (beta) subunit (PCNA family)